MRDYHIRCEKKHKRRYGKDCPKKSGRGRPLKAIAIHDLPKVKRVIPEPKLSQEIIDFSYAEYEALRLVDLLGYTLEEAGKEMGLSKTAIWRLTNSARRKVAAMLVDGKELFFNEEIRI